MTAAAARRGGKRVDWGRHTAREFTEMLQPFLRPLTRAEDLWWVGLGADGQEEE